MFDEERDDPFDNIELLVIETCLLKNRGVDHRYIQKIVDILQEYKEMKGEVKDED